MENNTAAIPLEAEVAPDVQKEVAGAALIGAGTAEIGSNNEVTVMEENIPPENSPQISKTETREGEKVSETAPNMMNSPKPSMTYEEMGNIVNEIKEQICAVAENQDRNGQELKNLYNNYSNILRLHDKAAEELDRHRNGLYHQLLDPVLSGLARIYIDYWGNLERLELEDLKDTRLTKNFSTMFDDILQILQENDVETYVSEPGDKYSPKFCKIVKKAQAAEKEQHGTVIKSLSPGFHIGNRVLIPENVEVYIFNNNQ